jgi:hypothetical protein
MARLLSILGPMTNLIDRKGSILNGEKDYVFGLWSKIYFWLIFDSFKILVRVAAYRRLNGRIWSTNYRWLVLGLY